MSGEAEASAAPDSALTKETPEPDIDSRAAVGYLIRPEADDYIAIMTVLEASVTEMSAAEVRAELARTGRRLTDEEPVKLFV